MPKTPPKSQTLASANIALIAAPFGALATALVFLLSSHFTDRALGIVSDELVFTQLEWTRLVAVILAAIAVIAMPLAALEHEASHRGTWTSLAHYAGAALSPACWLTVIVTLVPYMAAVTHASLPISTGLALTIGGSVAVVLLAIWASEIARAILVRDGKPCSYRWILTTWVPFTLGSVAILVVTDVF